MTRLRIQLFIVALLIAAAASFETIKGLFQ